MSSWSHARRRGEEMAEIVASFSLEVEVLIPFTCGFSCGDPCVYVPFTIERTVLEVVGGPTVGSADDWPLTEVLCGDEVSAPWPTRLLFESLSDVSAGRSLILGSELGDPNAGEWYRLRRTLLAPCR